MFRSPCALRSASCAALIALATAAGIVRAPETISPLTAPQPVPVATASIQLTHPTETRLVRRPRPPAILAVSLPRAERALPAFFPPLRPRRTSLHRLPFAVGPPAP